MENNTLRTELLAMKDADLALRQLLAAEGSLWDGYNERMAALHRRHNARLREILAEHGWPGPALADRDGAEAAWLLLQHAILDPDLMRNAVKLVERSVQAGDTKPRHLALLVDRIRVLEGRPQIYGSQFHWDQSGQLSPHPIEDLENVDARRATVGLEPLKDDTSRKRASAAEEGARAPANYQAYLDGAEEWARRTGWRTASTD